VASVLTRGSFFAAGSYPPPASRGHGLRPVPGTTSQDQIATSTSTSKDPLTLYQTNPPGHRYMQLTSLIKFEEPP